ncbi:carboxypeptidase regulatory-like domain-containing protein [Ktedonosporobacter rubrisoli]|uniref:Carboxypeptidase regulatory-like domain-containing protein n=1 Tax=Ktedonosporobacter rubrisoli TaxID=2509675 RepID=A0A4P6K0A4_KTERU|nr:carboxypeptidase-like regulatory domain-containing protein [Ktedonosporobacter rubrisoli]QBD81223.1 carboxypeptidase regulatory-like domain-containing protein [Ktedonosporobacter rubrisoli]
MIKPNKCLNLCLAFIFGLLLCGLPLFALPAQAAGGSGHISGQLVDGTNNNAPLAEQKVTLQVAQGDSARDLSTTTTDAHGNFAFSNLSTDKTLSYAAYINYKGAQYITDLVALDSKPEQQLKLTVYEPTQDPSKLAIVQATVLIHEPDPHTGTVTVSQLFDFKNLDTRSFVGSLDASQGKPKALFFSLPQGARNISLNKGFGGYKAIAIDKGFATNAAVLPGDNEFSLSFEVPATSPTYNYRYVAMYPTVALSFLVAPALHAQPDKLTAQGTVTADQHPYQLYRATGLLARQEVGMKLEGLAVSTPSAQVNTGNIWLIVALLVVVAVLFVGFFLYRARRMQAAPKAKTGQAKAVPDGKKTKSTDRRQILLNELLELDKDFEAGKLSKAVYQERRAKAKARLRSVMREEEAAQR